MGKLLLTVISYTFALSLIIGGVFLFCALASLPFWLMWNWLIPDIFGLPQITLLQAFGLWTFIVLIRSSRVNYSKTFKTDKIIEDGTESSPFGDNTWNQWVEQVKKKYQA